MKRSEIRESHLSTQRRLPRRLSSGAYRATRGLHMGDLLSCASGNERPLMRAARFTLALIITLLVAPALAASPMNERQARAAAVQILKGDPYGKTDAQVLKNIAEAQLVTAGSICGAKITRPRWRFEVFVPKARNPSGDNDIRGYLVIDAGTGKLVCAGLPFLD